MTERARVLRLRNVLGLTLRDLATEFGVASAAVAHWESGKRRMPGPPVVPPLGDRPALAMGGDDAAGVAGPTEVGPSACLFRCCWKVIGR